VGSGIADFISCVWIESDNTFCALQRSVYSFVHNIKIGLIKKYNVLFET
jgi:hypothetical protein